MKKSEFTTKSQVEKWYYKKTNENFYNIKKMLKLWNRQFLYNAVSIAIKNKIIKKNPCYNCGSKIKLEAHHVDYTKPLDIIWLCKKCHIDLHKEINKKN